MDGDFAIDLQFTELYFLHQETSLNSLDNIIIR